MPNHRRATLRPDDRYNVEPRRRRRDGAEAPEVVGRRFGQLMALKLIDLIFGRGIVIGSGFDFDEDQNLPVARDDVDLAEPAFPVAMDNLVPQVPQMLGRHVLAALSERITAGGARQRAEDRAE